MVVKLKKIINHTLQKTRMYYANIIKRLQLKQMIFAFSIRMKNGMEILEALEQQFEVAIKHGNKTPLHRQCV